MISDSPSIEIRALKEIGELRAVEDLQQEIWGCSDREILPALAIIPLLEIGGVLLGVFDGDELIGFVLGFPGIEDGRLILHSDMLAVKTAYRSLGLGYKLKLAQREIALAKGIDRITWTFDPLQSLNAHLNFAKLGVIASRYKINYYGETSSLLHQTGTDRLWVTWLLTSDRVHRLIAGEGVPDAPDLHELPSLVRVGEEWEPIRRDIANRQPFLKIEIPGNINALLEENVQLAFRWREATRHAFTSAMNADYRVEEFYRVARDKEKGVYLLGLR